MQIIMICFLCNLKEWLNKDIEQKILFMYMSQYYTEKETLHSVNETKILKHDFIELKT